MIKVTIHIKGLLDNYWADWFNGLEISYNKKEETIIKGILNDFTAFYGMLSMLNNLGIEPLLVQAKQLKKN